MNNTLKQYFAQVVQCHKTQYEQLTQLKTLLNSTKSLSELADIALTLREAMKYNDDMHSEIYKIQDVLSKVIGALWVQQSAMRAEGPQPILTEYCTVEPQLQSSATLPTIKKEPDKFKQLMDSFGIPEEHQYLLRFHWPSFNQYLSQCAAEGRPMPPGIDNQKTYQKYDLAIRQRKDILSGDEAKENIEDAF